ncbi:hypothetical protein Droror1_Dr00014881 [Drosera rotundifolia]
MTLLDRITKSTTTPTLPSTPSPHPIPFTFDPPQPDPNPTALIQPISGFSIPDTDSLISSLNSKFYTKLKRKIKNPNSISALEFTQMVESFLGQIRDKMGIREQKGIGRIGELGGFIGRDVMGLVIEGCIGLENWGVLRGLIEEGGQGVIEYGLWEGLIGKVVEKGRSELVLLCLRQFSDWGSSDLSLIIRYFLGEVREMEGVREEWEREVAAAACEATRDDGRVGERKMVAAKEATVFLMMGYDGFTVSELGLHFVFASGEVDEVVFSDAVGRLNVEETWRLIRYLGKWLRKYERFPMVGSCREAETVLRLKLCRWVPTLERIVKSLGLVLDVHFFSLILHPEFHEELKALRVIVTGLAVEGRLCCCISDAIEILQPEVVVS